MAEEKVRITGYNEELNDRANSLDILKYLLKRKRVNTNDDSIVLDKPAFLDYAYSDGTDGESEGEEYAVYANEIYMIGERVFAKCATVYSENELQESSFTAEHRITSSNVDNIKDDIFLSIVKSGDVELGMRVASLSALPPYLVAEFSECDNPYIRSCIAGRPDLPDEILQRMLENEGGLVESAALMNSIARNISSRPENEYVFLHEGGPLYYSPDAERTSWLPNRDTDKEIWYIYNAGMDDGGQKFGLMDRSLETVGKVDYETLHRIIWNSTDSTETLKYIHGLTSQKNIFSRVDDNNFEANSPDVQLAGELLNKLESGNVLIEWEGSSERRSPEMQLAADGGYLYRDCIIYDYGNNGQVVPAYEVTVKFKEHYYNNNSPLPLLEEDHIVPIDSLAVSRIDSFVQWDYVNEYDELVSEDIVLKSRNINLTEQQYHKVADFMRGSQISNDLHVADRPAFDKNGMSRAFIREKYVHADNSKNYSSVNEAIYGDFKPFWVSPDLLNYRLQDIAKDIAFSLTSGGDRHGFGGEDMAAVLREAGLSAEQVPGFRQYILSLPQCAFPSEKDLADLTLKVNEYRLPGDIRYHMNLPERSEADTDEYERNVLEMRSLEAQKKEYRKSLDERAKIFVPDDVLDRAQNENAISVIQKPENIMTQNENNRAPEGMRELTKDEMAQTVGGVEVSPFNDKLIGLAQDLAIEVTVGGDRFSPEEFAQVLVAEEGFELGSFRDAVLEKAAGMTPFGDSDVNRWLVDKWLDPCLLKGAEMVNREEAARGEVYSWGVVGDNLYSVTRFDEESGRGLMRFLDSSGVDVMEGYGVPVAADEDGMVRTEDALEFQEHVLTGICVELESGERRPFSMDTGTAEVTLGDVRSRGRGV